jgi:hypothetical protein
VQPLCNKCTLNDSETRSLKESVFQGHARLCHIGKDIDLKNAHRRTAGESERGGLRMFRIWVILELFLKTRVYAIRRQLLKKCLSGFDHSLKLPAFVVFVVFCCVLHQCDGDLETQLRPFGTLATLERMA